MMAELKVKCLEDKTMVTAVFDFQKTLLCPHGESSIFYYSRRLRNYHLTITDVATMETKCLLWNETEGAKGACEVASVVFSYLKQLTSFNVKTVNLFADRCGGQNVNRFVLIMLCYATIVLDIEEINMNFLVTGHSHNLNDTAHKNVETTTSHLKLFTTEMWSTAIQASFVEMPPQVEILDHTYFKDYKSKTTFPMFKKVFNDTNKIEIVKKLKTDSQVTNDTSSESETVENGKTKKEKQIRRGVVGEKVYWSKIMRLKLRKDQPGVMKFRYAHLADEELTTTLFEVANSKTRRQTDNVEVLKTTTLTPLYSSRLPISVEKYDALMKLCQKESIPKHFHSWYKKLPTTESSSEDQVNVASHATLDIDMETGNSSDKENMPVD